MEKKEEKVEEEKLIEEVEDVAPPEDFVFEG
jgi:hypothetical protein